MCEQFDLTTVKDRNVEDLSGGELQRFACAIVCVQRADVYVVPINLYHSCVIDCSYSSVLLFAVTCLMSPPVIWMSDSD